MPQLHGGKGDAPQAGIHASLVFFIFRAYQRVEQVGSDFLGASITDVVLLHQQHRSPIIPLELVETLSDCTHKAGMPRAANWGADRAEPLRCVLPMWQG